MYNAEITFNVGYDTEYGYEETFDTLQQAADQLLCWAAGAGINRAYINNKKVIVRNGYIRTESGETLCTNEKWHEIFAKPSEAFRPQTARPTNISTLKSLGIIL